MKSIALTVFAKPNGIKKLADLKGKAFAIGQTFGLLHTLMLRVLKEKGIDATQVKFVNIGSNEHCYEAVLTDEVDTC